VIDIIRIISQEGELLHKSSALTYLRLYPATVEKAMLDRASTVYLPSAVFPQHSESDKQATEKDCEVGED
jgi:hypothetical protein